MDSLPHTFFCNWQSNHSIILATYYNINFLVLAPFDQYFLFMNPLMKEKARKHLDLNRLNSKGPREEEVIDYREDVFFVFSSPYVLNKAYPYRM